jgi:hypothetical protein
MVGQHVYVFSERSGIASDEICSGVFIEPDTEKNREGSCKREFLGTYPIGIDAHLGKLVFFILWFQKLKNGGTPYERYAKV